MDTANDKALQRFAELMIEKIKQVEDNWQKPWFGIKGGDFRKISREEPTTE